MGIPQVDPIPKVGLQVPVSQVDKSGEHTSDAPQIPPRMKKQGPELPEKPPHLRLNSLTTSKANGTLPSSVHTSHQRDCKPRSEPISIPSGSSTNHQVSADKKLFLEDMRKKGSNGDREVLVAATKGSRDRPAERRQREPAKLLAPLAKPADVKVHNSIDKSVLPVLLGLASPKSRKKPFPTNYKPDSYKLNTNNHKLINGRITRPPVILIPRSQLDTRNLHHVWKSYPISYSVWVQNVGSGDAQVTSRLVRRAFSPNGKSTVELKPGIEFKGPRKSRSECKVVPTTQKNQGSTLVPGTTAGKPRSSSVTRSGSLTSQGSISSDSGNETFPKSVLKKHRRDVHNTSSSSNDSRKTTDQKKNVTFNAFATVQLMEE